MKTYLVSAAILIASVIAAHAGDNSCNGTIVVGPKMTKIESTFTSPSTGEVVNVSCSFLSGSSVGRRILKTCPAGSECSIDLDLGVPTNPITKGVYRVTKE